jgi:hypothetical protein
MEDGMSLTETQFTAIGPASIGFQTEPAETSNKFQVGVDASGLDFGVKGTATLGDQSPSKPNSGGTGVQGTGTGVGYGVAGFGGDATPGTGPVAPSSCAGVFGVGGSQTAQVVPIVGAPGVAGIGGPTGGVGVYGQGSGPGEQGGPGGPGVKGVGGANTPTDDADGVQGFASGAFSGVSGFGGNTSGTGVFGLGGGPGGPGVRGFGAGAMPTLPSNNPVGVLGQAGPNADGVQGFASGAFSGVSGFGGDNSGTGVFGLGGGPGGPGVRGFGSGATPLTVPSDPVGVYGQGGPQSPGVVGQAGSSNADGVQGYGSGVEGAGVRGVGTIGVVGIAANVDGATGVWADGGNPGTGALFVTGETGSLFAGPVNVEADFAQGGNFSAGVGPQGSLSISTNGVVVQGNFTVMGGMKMAAVPFPDGSHRQLYCMESPESWFEDFGVGRLTDGQARIVFDPDFAATINTDGYHVFITEYDDNNGLFVTNRTNKGFEVRAKTPTRRAQFGYRVVARRKDVASARLAKVTLPTESTEAALRKETWEQIKARLAKRD